MAGGGGAGDVNVTRRIERQRGAEISGCANLRLGQNGRAIAGQLEYPQAVALAVEEVEVAGCVGLHGAEAALGVARAQSGKAELLGGVYPVLCLCNGEGETGGRNPQCTCTNECPAT